MEEEKSKQSESEPRDEVEKETQQNKETPKEEPKGEKAQPQKKPETKKYERVRVTNCVKCSKTLKNGKWYYRNGKYYCNKRCWKAATARSTS